MAPALASGRLAGFEALVRWTHPELGAVGPDVFIPIAEESGLIVAVMDFVLHSAGHQLKDWQLCDPAFAALTMHVNVCGKDIGHTGLVARVTHAVVQAQLLPRLLEDLRTLGIGLSIDDFGTGYSSLAHLSSLPIDRVKVDRSFIRRLRRGSKEATVVRAIVNLGISLDKTVIAEGIETASQFAQRRDMACRFGRRANRRADRDPSP